MNELLGAFGYVRSTLLGPAQAGQRTADQNALRALVGDRVYAAVPPPIDPATGKKPAYPLIIMSPRSGLDVTVVNGASAYTNILMDVKAVGTGTLAAIEPIDTLIFQLLQTTGGIYGPLEIMGCSREGFFPLQQVDDDDTYRSLVQTFRLRISRVASP